MTLKLTWKQRAVSPHQCSKSYIAALGRAAQCSNVHHIGRLKNLTTSKTHIQTQKMNTNTNLVAVFWILQDVVYIIYQQIYYISTNEETQIQKDIKSCSWHFEVFTTLVN